MEAKLVLEDGEIFVGKSCGIPGTAFGEVVFNTSMNGYQEIMTDPSYAGQIVTFTYPLVGNYGVHGSYQESAASWAQGIIVKELCTAPGGSRIDKKLQAFLEEQRLVGICDIDTRTLTKHLRVMGTMRGIITTEDIPVEELTKKAQSIPHLSEIDLVAKVTCEKPYILPGGQTTVAVIDMGVKHNILRSLTSRGCTVVVLPAKTAYEDIMKYSPQGIILSNGPGDPKTVSYVANTVKKLLGKVPIMGICMGHQVLGIALGGETFKLKFGHRGGNHPVKNLQTGRVDITSQNHGFALKEEGLPHDVEITHVNLNDGTVEGIEHKNLPAFSIQYHPEGAPGPHDSRNLFDKFLNMVEGDRGNQSA